ncbi:hypothetical protein CK203_001391 [Vitis vinifera]|uniref:Uncharacterized protein n=1 Tax=Vitis vinifera TaxID=29760 RepID=A0A438KKJ7_VITVI|nr:hypothetical protein CK203_001391 [Vitis vinifera]
MSASREWTMFPVSKMRLLAAASKVALSFSLECSLRKDPHVGLCKKEGNAFGKCNLCKRNKESANQTLVHSMVIAEYDPKNDLLDQEFMLKGKWFQRKDLEHAVWGGLLIHRNNLTLDELQRISDPQKQVTREMISLH